MKWGSDRPICGRFYAAVLCSIYCSSRAIFFIESECTPSVNSYIRARCTGTWDILTRHKKATWGCLQAAIWTKPLPLSEKTHPHSILQVPTTQLAKMSIDPKFVELTADVVRKQYYRSTAAAVLTDLTERLIPHAICTSVYRTPGIVNTLVPRIIVPES